MTTSCCASYAQFVKKHLPAIKPFVSNTKTPLYYIAQKAKEEHQNSVTVFISPCAAKKNEAWENENVDYVINCEELNALLVVKNIKVQDCREEKFKVESSKQGRGFAVTGGVVNAVSKFFETFKSKNSLKPYVVNGFNKGAIEQLKKMSSEQKCEGGNLVEVMGCEGGCICGNATVCAPKIAHKSVKVLLEQSKDITGE